MKKTRLNWKQKIKKTKQQTKLYLIILGEVPSFLELLQLFPTLGKVIVFAGARCCRFIEQLLMKTSHLFQTIRSHRNLPFDKSWFIVPSWPLRSSWKWHTKSHLFRFDSQCWGRSFFWKLVIFSKFKQKPGLSEDGLKWECDFVCFRSPLCTSIVNAFSLSFII